MDTPRPIQSRLGNGSVRLHTQTSTPTPQSSNRSFRDSLRAGLAQGAGLAHHAANLALPMVPGATTMSAALSEAASALTHSGSNNAQQFALDGTGGTPPATQNINELQKNMLESNEMMLFKQMEISYASNSIMARSNIVKLLHETNKSIITNFR